MATPPLSSAQTFINQIHQEGFTPLSEFEEDPFWDSLIPVSNPELTENQQVKNNAAQNKEPKAGQGILDGFDIQDFRSHIKG